MWICIWFVLETKFIMATNPIKRCLVCNCDEADASLLDVGSKTSISDLLERELTVMMFLRKSLSLKKKFLVSILQNVGESPSGWNVKLCPICYEVFEKMKFVWSRLKALEEEFDNLSNVLKRKLSESSGHVDENKNNETTTNTNGRTRRNRGKFLNNSKNGNSKKDDCISNQIRTEFMHLHHNNQAGKVGIKSNRFKSGFADDPSKQIKMTTSTLHSPIGLNVKMEPEITKCTSTTDSFAGSSNLLEDVQMEVEDNEQFYNDDVDFDQEVASSLSSYNSDKNTKNTATTHSQRQRIWRFARREKGTILQGVPRDDKFVCPRCEKKFLSLSLCDDHILNYHYSGTWPTTVSCHICDLKFKRENWLRIHMKMRHPGIKIPSDELVDSKYEVSYPVIALGLPNEANEVDILDHQTSSNEDHFESLMLPVLQRDGNIREITLPSTFSRLPDEVKAKLTQTSEDQYCHSCDKKFPTVIQYESHMHGKHHGEKNPYECPLSMCSKKYEKIGKLIIHIERSHASNKLICPICSKTFAGEIYLNAHVQRVHFGIKCPYKCIKCGIGHSRKAALNKHLKNVHKLQLAFSLLDRPEVRKTTVKNSKGVEQLPCEICLNDKISIKFKSQEELDAHVKGKHMGISKPYQCTICPKDYNRYSSLEVHMKTHTVRNDELLPGEKSPTPYVCNPCGKEFKSITALKAHRKGRYHENLRPFVCEICSQKFTLLLYLKNHQTQKHHEELKLDPLFKCSYCDKVLNSARNLNNHIKLHHTKNAKYQCPYCNVQSQYESAMKLHINVRHTKTNKHLCPHCAKTFSNPQYLNNHLRIHAGEKPHECKFCFKKFSDSSTCKRHEESHSGIEHTCPHCAKGGFKTRHALGVHIKIHKVLEERKRKHTVGTESVGTSQSFEPDHKAETLDQKQVVD